MQTADAVPQVRLSSQPQQSLSSHRTAPPISPFERIAAGALTALLMQQGQQPAAGPAGGAAGGAAERAAGTATAPSTDPVAARSDDLLGARSNVG